MRFLILYLPTIMLFIISCCLVCPAHKAYAQTILYVSSDFSTKISELSIDNDRVKELGEKKLNKKNVMQLLKTNLNVVTAFGGGFVNQIQGVPAESNNNKAWFYFINGMLADVGASAYILHKDDRVWWDYHTWDDGTLRSGLTIKSVIGEYPYPFLRGLNAISYPTVVVANRKLLSSAERLCQALNQKGVKDCLVQGMDVNINYSTQNNIIVIGEFHDLSIYKEIGSVYKDATKRNSLLFSFDGDKLNLLNKDGDKIESKEDSAIICATAIGVPATSFWFVMAHNSELTNAAIDILVKTPSKIQHMAGAVLTAESINSLPLIVESVVKSVSKL